MISGLVRYPYFSAAEFEGMLGGAFAEYHQRCIFEYFFPVDAQQQQKVIEYF